MLIGGKPTRESSLDVSSRVGHPKLAAMIGSKSGSTEVHRDLPDQETIESLGAFCTETPGLRFLSSGKQNQRCMNRRRANTSAPTLRSHEYSARRNGSGPTGELEISKRSVSGQFGQIVVSHPTRSGVSEQGRPRCHEMTAAGVPTQKVERDFFSIDGIHLGERLAGFQIPSVGFGVDPVADNHGSLAVIPAASPEKFAVPGVKGIDGAPSKFAGFVRTVGMPEASLATENEDAVANHAEHTESDVTAQDGIVDREIGAIEWFRPKFPARPRIERYDLPEIGLFGIIGILVAAWWSNRQLQDGRLEIDEN